MLFSRLPAASHRKHATALARCAALHGQALDSSGCLASAMERPKVQKYGDYTTYLPTLLPTYPPTLPLIFPGCRALSFFPSRRRLLGRGAAGGFPESCFRPAQTTQLCQCNSRTLSRRT